MSGLHAPRRRLILSVSDSAPLCGPDQAVVQIEPVSPRGEPYQELLSPENNHGLSSSLGAAPGGCSPLRHGILAIRLQPTTSSPCAGPAVQAVLEARQLNSPNRNLDIVTLSSFASVPRSDVGNSTSTNSLFHSYMATDCTGSREKLTSPG